MKILGHICTISGQFEIGSQVENISQLGNPVFHEWINNPNNPSFLLCRHLWNARHLSEARELRRIWGRFADRGEPALQRGPPGCSQHCLSIVQFIVRILSVSTLRLQSFPIRCCWTASSYSYQRTTMWNMTLGRGSWTGTRSSSKTTQQRTARNTGSISRYISNSNTHKNMIQSWRL